MEERIENLQRIIKNTLASTDEQIQGDLRDSLRLRMSVSENLYGEVSFLRKKTFQKIIMIFQEYGQAYQKKQSLYVMIQNMIMMKQNTNMNLYILRFIVMFI